MKISLSITSLAVLIFSIAGCVHYRDTHFVLIKGESRKIKTQNRYTLVDLKHKMKTANADIAQGNTYEMQFSNENLKRFQPDVFSDDGIRFVVNSRMLKVDNSNSFAQILLFVTLHTTSSAEHRWQYVIDVLDNPDAKAVVESHCKYDQAFSLLPIPTPLLFYMGDAAVPEGKEDFSVFTRHYVGADCHNARMDNSSEIYAYTLAVALKKMEDDGLIKDLRGKREKTNEILLQTLDEKFEIEDFCKDGNCEYRYAFRLKRRGGNGISLRDSREARQTLRLMIRDDYKLSYPDVSTASLIVDFSEFSQRGGTIAGRAAILLLNVESLCYDPHARKGEMRIRIGENQFEDARIYARKNIASLARDKNIALNAREIPPAATFYLLGEVFKDGILEITFKTE